MNQRHFGGKRGSPRRHSTTNFSENVEVEKTSYQLFEALSFCDRESAYTSSLEVTVLTFLVNNGKMNFFPGVKSRTRSLSRP